VATNSPPRVDGVRFEPAQPGRGESVRAIVEATDPDGDHVVLGYAWSLDGEGVTGDDSRLEIGRHVRRGAELEVRVTASDGHAESAPFVWATSIGNRPPRVSSLTIQPAGRITAAGPITAIASGSDPDDDPIHFEYTWTVNGAVAESRDSEFPDTELKRGDLVQVSVVAADEQSESEPLVSPEIEVANAAPVIRSQPDLGEAADVFAYQIVAEDADGDSLRYGAGRVPEGMTVVAESGRVLWTPREDQIGVHAVELWAADPQGARVTQRFELTIGAPPVPAAPAPAAEAPAPGD